MSNIKKVALNEYLHNLREAIVGLSSVSDCNIYNGTMNLKSIENTRPDLYLEESTCYLEVANAKFIKNKVAGGHDADVVFNIYIVALNDYNNPDTGLRSQSETCLTTIDQISKLLDQNKFSLNVISFPDQIGFGQIDIGDTEDEIRYSIYGFSFSQRMNFNNNLNK